MSSELLFETRHREKRVALLEQGALAELYVERPGRQTLVGSIYQGRVVRVLPGMDAAFVDIGLEKAGFLYVSDVLAPDSPADLDMDDGGDEPAIHDNDLSADKLGERRNISDLLRGGQDLLVQVAKDPIGTKGARLTTHISLPGRLLVYLPTIDHVGISRRLDREDERVRLREILERLRPTGAGAIIRTAAEGADEEALAADLEFLIRLWNDIRQRQSSGAGPRLLYRDLDLIGRATRDLFTTGVDRLVIDDAEGHRQLLQFVRTLMPALASRVELYTGELPLFSAMGLEVEIARALERKVWLKSGGTIVIDQTEALTAIDVNTGRYVGKHNLEETITQTNLEAVKEIALQLRLRDIGGIIIIDFIDMERPANRDKVFSALQEALARDRARCHVLKVSELGLVEMTRKRVRESLTRALTQACPYCQGAGRVRSAATVCFDVLRAIERDFRGRPGEVALRAHPDVAAFLLDEAREALEDLEARLRLHLRVEAEPAFHLEQFDIRPLEAAHG